MKQVHQPSSDQCDETMFFSKSVPEGKEHFAPENRSFSEIQLLTPVKIARSSC